MNDFVRDKFTPKKGEGTIPLYGEIIAGGTVSQHFIFDESVQFAPKAIMTKKCLLISSKTLIIRIIISS